MTSSDPFVGELDRIFAQAEAFARAGAKGDAAARAMHLVRLADRELVRRPPDRRAAVETRRFLALRLIEELRAPKRAREDLAWLERAIAQLDVAIHAVLADRRVTREEEAAIAQLDLGRADGLVDARQRLAELSRALEGVTSRGALESRVRGLAERLPPAARRDAMRIVVVLARNGSRLARAEGYRDAATSGDDRELVALFARALEIDDATLADIQIR